MGSARWKGLLDRASLAQHLAVARERWFDLRHGLDTRSHVSVDAMQGMPEDAARHAVHYEPTPIHKFRRALSILDLDPGRYRFVDFGSGKGRVLMLAAAFGFRQVVGVEVSPGLHQIAQANVAAFARKHPGYPPIQCVCCDARDFMPPEGNLLAFFYNPFDAEVLEPVLDRILDASVGMRNDLALVYINPMHHHIIGERTGLRCLAKDSALAVYQGP